MKIQRRKIERKKWHGIKFRNLTPKFLIHKHCAMCTGSTVAANKCKGNKLLLGPCLFFRIRNSTGKISTKIIRRFCLECMGKSSERVDNCKSTGCYLHPYRSGKRFLGGMFTQLKR
jgi:hypothetical protein